MLKRAFDRAAMSVTFAMEAAEHYGEPYPLTQQVKNWIEGFYEAVFGY